MSRFTKHWLVISVVQTSDFAWFHSLRLLAYPKSSRQAKTWRVLVLIRLRIQLATSSKMWLITIGLKLPVWVWLELFWIMRILLQMLLIGLKLLVMILQSNSRWSNSNSSMISKLQVMPAWISIAKMLFKSIQLFPFQIKSLTSVVLELDLELQVSSLIKNLLEAVNMSTMYGLVKVVMCNFHQLMTFSMSSSNSC